MIERIYKTDLGDIHYYTNKIQSDRISLIFLPGLTADHRLFDKQIAHFIDKCNVLVWDAPGHAASRPFELEFSLKDKAGWLHGILKQEGIENPYLIGQSMGGYVGQAYEEYFPGNLAGFIIIDSAPLQRHYMTAAEIWILKNMEPIYRWYPWKSLLKAGSKGVATTTYGQKLMYTMMMDYDSKSYAKLVGHGYRILAEAVEKDLDYEIDCPALLICGEQDKAGSAKNYNKRWHEKTGIPIAWIKDAGHNANTDQPQEINRLIEEHVFRATSS